MVSALTGEVSLTVTATTSGVRMTTLSTSLLVTPSGRVTVTGFASGPGGVYVMVPGSENRSGGSAETTTA